MYVYFVFVFIFVFCMCILYLYLYFVFVFVCVILCTMVNTDMAQVYSNHPWQEHSPEHVWHVTTIPVYPVYITTS